MLLEKRILICCQFQLIFKLTRAMVQGIQFIFLLNCLNMIVVTVFHCIYIGEQHVKENVTLNYHHAQFCIYSNITPHPHPCRLQCLTLI